MRAASYACLALAMFGTVEAGLFSSGAPTKADGVEEKKYPASYPYENESFINVFPPGKDNVLDPETTPEVGGYAAHQVNSCNPFSYFPYGMPSGGESDCGRYVQFWFYHVFGIAYEIVKPFNCSVVKIFNPNNFNKGFFDGSPQVCEWESCCSDYHNVYQVTEDFLVLQERWNGRWGKYGCKWITEDIYCGLILYETHWCREEYYSGALGAGDALKRWVMMPCQNVYAYYLENCSTFKLTGAKSIAKATRAEPDGFMDDMTAQEANSVLGIWYGNDRVCIPLSTIDPSTKKAEGAPAGAAAAPAAAATPGAAPAAAAGTPAAAAAATPAASAATVNKPFALFASIAALFSVVRAF